MRTHELREARHSLLAHASSGVATFLQAGPAVFAWIAVAIGRTRQRRALARLDDRLLRDIGIDHRAAEHEITKPFWRD